MAGHVGGVFPEKLSPFLKRLEDSPQSTDPDLARTIARQYRRAPEEALELADERRRHYEAEVQITYAGRPLRGLERLYRRSAVLTLTTICAAHCRWCVRGQYESGTLSDDEIEAVARYCGSAPEARDLNELVLTGGDPLMTPSRLERAFAFFEREAPQIEVFRVGTRVPVHDPERVNGDLLRLLGARRERVEIALHVNHASELQPPVTAAIRRLQDAGLRIYEQGVLLKGLNDSEAALVELADRLRRIRIEMHYLFHCAPIRGMSHHRTSVARGLALHGALVNSGAVSGRAKPTYALLTDVGKVAPYEGTILASANGRLLLQTHYSYTERRQLNPSWTLPPSATVDAAGRLRVAYLDGCDDDGPS